MEGSLALQSVLGGQEDGWQTLKSMGLGRKWIDYFDHCRLWWAVYGRGEILCEFTSVWESP
jgi:hypothetical protein